MGLGAEAGGYRSKILNANRRTLDDRGTTTPTAGRPATSPVPSWSSGPRVAGQRRFDPDVLEVWRPSAHDVRRGSDATHFPAQDRPEETAEQLLAFLAGR